MKKLLATLAVLAILISCASPIMADSQTHLGKVISYRVSQRGDWFFLKFRAQDDSGNQTEELQLGPIDKSQAAVYCEVLSEANVHAYRVVVEEEERKDDDAPLEYYDFFVLK